MRIDPKKIATLAVAITIGSVAIVPTSQQTESAATAYELAAKIVIPSEGDKPIGYRDPLGIPTAGLGHTGPDVVVGKFYDDATRMGWLAGDLAEANRTVDRCAPKTINTHQRAAYISFALNVGPGKKGVKDGFCILKKGKTPRHIRKARDGDIAGSCNALLAWDKPKHLPGIPIRRQKERDLCITPVATDVAITSRN
jgi:lysozyme